MHALQGTGTNSVGILPPLCDATINARSVSRQNGRFVLQGTCSVASAALVTTFVFADYARVCLKAFACVFLTYVQKKNPLIFNPRRIFHDISEAAKICLSLGLIRLQVVIGEMLIRNTTSRENSARYNRGCKICAGLKILYGN